MVNERPLEGRGPDQQGRPGGALDRPDVPGRPGRVGLLFTGGEGPGPAQCRRLLEEAAAVSRSAPLICAADSGLLLAERAGLRPGWVLGDMDSLGPEGEKRLAAWPPERVIRSPAAKDHTDTELALSFLREQGCGPVWIAGGGGGRTDQLFAIRSLFERSRPPARWITAAEDIRVIEAAAAGSESAGPPLPVELAVSSPAPDGPAPLFPVSVFPLGDGPWAAASSGLRWPLAGLPWDRGFFGISNEAPEGRFLVRAERGRFMVMFPLR